MMWFNFVLSRFISWFQSLFDKNSKYLEYDVESNLEYEPIKPYKNKTRLYYRYYHNYCQ